MEGLIMLTKDSLSMKGFVVENKGLFEQVAKDYKYSTKYREKKYTQLNYGMILNEMVEFVNGYIEYKEKDSEKFRGKVLGTAKSFYDDMFTNKKKYRKKLYLPDIKNSYADFLRGTKNLQDLLEKNVDRAKADPEFDMLITMTDNQYRKLSKVCRDDMQIYLWLATEGSSYEYHISGKLRADFVDDHTPVLHPKKIKAGDIEKYGEGGPEDE
jgi:hypothetical protein